MPTKIQVTCKTSLNIPLDELHEIQGELKEMTEESYLKFRRLIEKRGIWFASHVWKEPLGKKDGKNAFRWCIVDGTGRRRALLKIRADGCKIPPVPCVEIEAKNLKDAKAAVLASSSQFHNATPQGLYEFITDAGLTVDDLAEYEVSGIDHDKFLVEFFDVPVSDQKQSEGAAELDKGTFTKFSQECPRCGFSFGEEK